MFKLTRSFFVFVFLLAIINLSKSEPAREYFYYYNGLKTDMDSNPFYISIKFNSDVDEAVQYMLVQNALGDYIESNNRFKVTQRNGAKSLTFIVKLKNNVNFDALNNRINNFRDDSRVRYIGSAFTKNDKVIHLVTDEIIVKYKQNTTEYEIRNLNKLFNTSIIDRVYPDKKIFLISINNKGGTESDNAFDVSNKFQLTQFVDFAQPNFIRIGMLCFVPNDTLLPMQWNIKNTGNNIPGGPPGIAGCDLNLEPAWDSYTGNHKVIIGMIDTGVDTDHVDLRQNLVESQLWYNALDESHNPSDGFNHGTAESGVAAAIGNNIAGICGVAWNCSLMPVKVFSDEAYTTDLILGKGLNWAWEHGADVLNNSWGGGTYTPFITLAIQNAKTYGRNGKGAVVFAATGNQDSAGIFYPSVLPEVIAVGGISPCFQRKSTTSCDGEDWGADYGEGLSVVAPTPKIGCTIFTGGWAFYCNGTSACSPQITAIGALILTKNINLSADSVRLIIERTARKVGNYSYNITKPNGLWNNEMGYGLPDAKACLDMTPPGPQVIYDQVPPVIKITPPRSGLLNNNLVINATITDNLLVAGGNNIPRLYYNISNSSVTGIINGLSGPNNNYTFTFPAGTPLLNYGMSMRYYIAAQDTSSNGNITTYPVGGRGVNPPGTFAPPKKLYLQNTGTRDTTIRSLDIPIHFVAETETTIVSHINIPFNKTVLGVKSLINLTHDYMGDLSLSLLSPSGTEIVLAAGIGSDGQGFINTNFDDYSPNSIQDTNFRYPYTGSYSPVDKLWLMNGENSSGEWTLKIVDNYAPEQGTLNSWSITLTYSTDRDVSDVPNHFELMENFPNPFNPITRIPFDVPYYSRVKIIVYDITGREVAKLLDEFRSPRFNDFVDFDINSVRVNGGSGIASGIYFYSLYSNEKFVKSRRMVILK